MSTLNDHQAILLTKALDGELSADERNEFERLIEADESVRREWEAMQRLKEVTTTMKFKQPPQETWDRYWAGVYARLERGIAWLLVSVGAAALLAAAGYEMVMRIVQDTEMSLPIKLALGALMLGLAILAVSIFREKWYIRKTDKYREVIR